MEAVEPTLDQGLGARLRSAREARGLSVEECAERLYLPGSVLEALEAEQFAALGAGVFARGHLRRYASLLELDAPALEQLLMQRLAAAPDLASIVTRHVGSSQPRRRLGLLPVAIVAVVLAVAVLVWWASRNASAPKPAPVPVPVPATQGAAPPAPATAPATAPAPPSAAQRPVVMPDDTPADIPAAAALDESSDADAPLVVAAAPPRLAAPAPTSKTALPLRRATPAPVKPAAPRQTPGANTNFDY